MMNNLRKSGIKKSKINSLRTSTFSSEKRKRAFGNQINIEWENSGSLPQKVTNDL